MTLNKTNRYNKEMFNQTNFNQFIIDNNIIGLFKEPLTLKSGKQSIYILIGERYQTKLTF